MRIFKVSRNRPSFGTNERVVKQDGKLVLRNCTRLMREDMDWDYIAELLQGRKIYCYACSDGSEAYSLKLALIKKLGLKKSQDIQIEARDIDREMVKKAQSGVISLSPKDFYAGKVFLGKGIEDLFIPQTDEFSYTIVDKQKFYSRDISECKLKRILSLVKKDKVKEFFERYRIAKSTKEYRASEGIRRGINFNIGNIVQEAEGIDYGNTVILFRNVWPYLKDSDIEKLLNVFKRKFTDRAFLVLGYFDKKPKVINTDLNLPEKLEKIGLREIYPKVYTK